MRFGVQVRALFWVALSSALWLAFATPAAHAQLLFFGRARSSSCPPCPCLPPDLSSPIPPGTTPEQAPRPPAATTEPALGPEQAFASAGETVALATPNMQGDLLGIPALSFTVNQPSSARSVLVPSIRTFKIADNESPRPQDRVYFGFNYYDDVNKAVNERLGADLAHERVYRETFALEKTFLDGDGSIGLRVPLNTLSADSTTPGLGGSSTDVGDLAVILKYAPWRNAENGNLVSLGLLISTPTGPNSFAGSRLFTGFHSTTLQPFVGYIWGKNDWFVHGFTAVDVPTDSRDVTVLYNDIGVGYFVYSDRACRRWLSAVAPTLELHVNTPLNHRGGFNFTDPTPTPDGVDLTMGVTFEINRRATWAIGFVTPLAGPRPFDFEVLTQFNLRF